MLQESLANAIR